MRRVHSNKELDQLQKIKKENEKLKRTINFLRKQITKLDHYDNIKEINEQQDDHQEVEKLKLDRWKCYECKEGLLKLIIFERRDGKFYYRRCNNCNKRTKVQKYTNSVEK